VDDRAGAVTPVRTALALTLTLLLGVAAAQRSDAVESAWRDAVAAQQTALAEANVASPDQVLWREAIAAARAADALAPDDAEVVRTLAQTYSYTRWYVRAWDAWERYLTLGGSLDRGLDAAQVAEAGTELGYARYLAGDLVGALPLYGRVLEAVPDNEESLTWLGRIHFERNEAALAAPYWERLAELHPDDPGIAYYLNRTRQRLSVGVAASDAFTAGIAAYEADRFDEALAQFERALADNPDFLEAFIWAARSALDLERPGLALGYWDRALELDPNDGRSQYFRELSRAQIDWGVAAAGAFYRGQARYTEGDLEGANRAFVAAASANPDYVTALVWAARTHQEMGNPGEAIGYWQSVLRLDPGDARAAYFLNLAQQQLTYGVEAGQAFVDGISHFQAAEFEAAEEDLRAAADANPDFADAWGWLGRLFFSQARYAEAADAYGLAVELEPDNDDYAFFADEAERLSGR
jgi:tetratricopeptide (TPR) repeat protein